MTGRWCQDRQDQLGSYHGAAVCVVAAPPAPSRPSALRRLLAPRLVGRFVLLQVGLFIFGLTVPITLQAHLGLTPWDVLHQGLSRHTPLTIGLASEAVGLVILVLSWILGIRPGVGTVSNMVMIGFWIDRVLAWGWIPDEGDAPLAVRFGMLGVALLLMGVASGAYIAPRLGAGPRDSMMLALAARTGRPVALIRGALESSACLAGFLLGGTVGIGTLLIALLLGPSVQAGLRLFGFNAHVAVVVTTPHGPVAVDDAAPEGV